MKSETRIALKKQFSKEIKKKINDKIQTIL